MTVRQLMIALSRFDPESLVIVSDSEEGNQPIEKLRSVQFLPEEESGKFSNATVPAVLISF